MEPISTAIMIAQGVKLALTGVKETAQLAKETFHELEEMIGAGASLMDAMPSFSKFFSHSSKYEEKRIELVEAQQKQDAAVEEAGTKPAEYISDAEYVLEMMAIDREQKMFYENIKQWLIYNFSEAGLWDDFNRRLNKLQSDRQEKAEIKRKAETEKRLAEKILIMKKRREKQKFWDNVQIIIGVIFGAVATLVTAYGILWMFKQGGY
jgi:hypothetical protein